MAEGGTARPDPPPDAREPGQPGAPVAQADGGLVLQRRRMLAALIGGQVCLHAAMTGLRMALPLMLLRQGSGGWLGGTAEAGVLLGRFALAPVLAAVPAGRWVDRRGYHRPVRASAALVVLGGLCAVPAAAWPAGA
jgi:MFS family permease